MAKIIFVSDTEKDPQEHKAGWEDAQEIFRLAEQLSEAELKRMARVIAKIQPENQQNIS